MKLAIFSALLLFVGLASSGPVSQSCTESLVITEEYFPDNLVIYTSQNDIVNILTPLNSLNFEEYTEDAEEAAENVILFFVEKDLASGEDRGLFIRNKTEVTKLLATGRDSAASFNDEKDIYFAASDGIYKYNVEKNKAEKYGTVTDDLINIAVDTDKVIYVLTKNKELFKVTDNGEKKVKISDVLNAEQIILDYNNNLYYYTTEKDVFVINEGGVKQIQGLPKNPQQLTILRPPYVLEDGVPLVVGNKGFVIYANGTSESGDIKIEAKPTAYSMEAFLIQYYAYNKKIYEFNILSILTSDDYTEIKSYVNKKTDNIQSVATSSRGSLRRKNHKSKKN